MERVALYAGSFDPPTRGHLWMIEKGVKLFDKLVVAIGVNPAKKTMFSVPQRIHMLKESVKGIPGVELNHYWDQFTVAVAHSVGAKFLLRGVRGATDCEQERVVRNVNHEIDPTLLTVWLNPPPFYADISSSLVKSLIGPEGWERVLPAYVTDPVLTMIKEVRGGK